MPKIISTVQIAANALQRGELVAFSTETVYGLGAIATDSAAVKKVYDYKGRPYNHPLILHVHHPSQLLHWCHNIPKIATKIAEAFMPGPLTLLLPKKDIHTEFTAHSDYLAVRIPSHPVAQQLLQAVNSGVVAPSANRFGYISPTCAQHVQEEFSDKDDLLILDGGNCSIGIESTIVGFVHEDYFIARPGDITSTAIEKLLNKKPIDIPITTRAPGLLKKHYSPNTPLQLCTKDEIAIKLLADKDTAVAVLAFTRPLLHSPQHTWLAAPLDAKEYAHVLYKSLRAIDVSPATSILIEIPPLTDEWLAIHNRLQRAAGGYD